MKATGSSNILKGMVVIILVLVLVQFLYSTFRIIHEDYTFLINRSLKQHHFFTFQDYSNTKQIAKPPPPSVDLEVAPNNNDEDDNQADLNLCPLIPPDLVGPFAVNYNITKMEDANLLVGKDVLPGGHWKPKDCRARDRVAFIIPYRDRLHNLYVLLGNLHPLLQRQKIDYGIFVMEQLGNDSFNKGALMNAGFVEASRYRQFDCFVFHDVDHIPEDDRNIYSCPDQPKHMSVAVDAFDYELPYPEMFGGVAAMSLEHFEKVNGYSNMFWDWGSEDDDMFGRVKAADLHIIRYPQAIARYTMHLHRKQKRNPNRTDVFLDGPNRFKTDGLNSLRYRRVEVKLYKLYTWMLIQIPPRT